MSDRMFGRLESMDPTTLWRGGREEFISWLAEADNLDLLVEALGIDLEVEAADRTVGPLTADLLCRDMADDSRVLVETQLSETDNDYLGRLITYAAGLDAGKIVWIAARFCDQHRAAMDWLNRLASSRLSFYAVELQILRVNGSRAAPRFNLLASPNRWTRKARSGVRAIETGEISENRRLQQDYWSALMDHLRGRGGPLRPSGKPAARSWAGFRLGRSGARLSAVQQRREQCLRVEVALSGDEAAEVFAMLVLERQAIEATVGYPLDWEAPARDSGHRISITAKGAALENRTDWARQHQWLAERLEEFYRAFAGRLRASNDDIPDHPQAAE